MKDLLRVSPRVLGEMNSPKFCPCCFWTKIPLGFRPPYQFPMPGIMFNLDRFEKLLVNAHFDSHNEAPEWLSSLRSVRPVDFPPKMTMDFPEYGVTLVGMLDALLQLRKNHVLIDYKTAKFKGDSDPFMPNYQSQLSGYTVLIENCGVGKVERAALVYFENCVKQFETDPLALLTEEGMNVPFKVVIHEVDIDRDSIPVLLKRFREYADMPSPPEGKKNCPDCRKREQLCEMFASVERSGVALRAHELRDRATFNHILRSMYQKRHKAALDGCLQLCDTLDDHAFEEIDSVPSIWDL